MSTIRFDVGGLHFEWDSEKAAANHLKHGVTFLEAATAFEDDLSLTVPDPLHSQDESRFILIGLSAESRMLTVVHVERDVTYRIISARKPTSRERRDYERKL
ncbi:MAG: BrnT family toxin [Acidobacteriaceae bacterium]